MLQRKASQKRTGVMPAKRTPISLNRNLRFLWDAPSRASPPIQAQLSGLGQLLSSWGARRHYGFTDYDGRRPDWGALAIDWSLIAASIRRPCSAPLHVNKLIG